MIASSKIFVLVSLIIPLTGIGLLLCANSFELDYEQTKAVGFSYGDEVEAADGGVAGIHLGTTYSSVAVFKRPLRKHICDPRQEFGRCVPLSNADIFQIVPNEHGSSTTPSCVAFTNDSRVLVGEPAKAHAAIDPPRTICGATRLVGRRFDDPDIKGYIKTLPYKVVNKKNMPHIQVDLTNGETRLFRPEEICAMILGKMKEIAEAYTGNEIELAVVLVNHRNPMSFDGDREVMRQRIKEAGKMVGLNVVRVGNGRLRASTLARRMWLQPQWRVLVYYLGGASTSATMVYQPLARERDDSPYGVFGVIASTDDENLGGHTFDTRVVDYFVELIKSKYGKDISRDSVALAKLRLECEKAKISLSSTHQTMLKIEPLADGIELFEEPLTRATFEELNMDLFNRTMDLVRGAMFNKLDRLDEVIVIGGNTRIPRIQHMLKELLGREPQDDVLPDHALAFAATHMTNFNNYDRRNDLLIHNSMGVGIESIGGLMKSYITSIYSLPVTMTGYVTTSRDGQTTVEIKVFEGFRRLTKDCHYLGKLELSDLPSAPRGVVVIKVQVEVDLRNNVRVTATLEGSKKTKSITIPFKERYGPWNIEREFQKHWDFREQDKMEVTKVEEALKTIDPHEADPTTMLSIVSL